MENVLYTLTALIEILESGMSRFHESDIEWESDRSCFYATLQCCGYSVDVANENAFDGWEELEMRYMECSPFLPEDEVDFKDDGGAPYRTHDYKRCYMRLCITPPADRKRGDTYTESQVRDMVEVTEYGPDIPGMGFEYYNIPESYEDIGYDE